MYITVKYGHNESLLCNPMCAVINLLTNIKRRAGYANTNVCLDLSDETGLVKDLDLHRYDYANKHLTSHSVYILVEKQTMPMEDDPSDDMFEHSTPLPPQYSFVPLLEEYKDLFPDYQLRVQHVERHKPSHKRRQVAKSPSPAGVKGVRGSRASKSRTSSRRK